jgi:hypothetical protein
MSVDLSKYVSQLEAEVNPPGTDLFPDAINSDWVLRLRNGFWNARLDGFLTGFTENADGQSAGIVSATQPSGAELDQIGIQLIIFYATLNTVTARLSQLNTTFRVSAGGGLSFETQFSSNVLRDLLKELTDRRKQLIQWMSQEGWIPIGYMDAYTERDYGILLHQIPWLRG